MKLFSRILPFFQSKKIILIGSLIFLFFLLTPLSINQINQKITGFIQDKSKSQLLHLEKQMGLRVRWEKLDFRFLPFDVKLQGISLEEASNPISKKNLLFDFLNGTQYIETLFIRPSLISFLFQKKISLSKIRIVSGSIKLKTATKIQKAIQTEKTLILPIKKIEIKNTNLSLEHQNRQVLLSDMNIHLKRRGPHLYDLKGVIKKTKIHQEDPFVMTLRGLISPNKIQMDHIRLQNEKISVQADSFSLFFKSQKILQMTLETSGQLPFSSFYNLAQLFNKKIPNHDGILSYNLNLDFDHSTGYKGDFQIQSQEVQLRERSLRSFKAKGIISKYSLLIDKAQAQLTEKDWVQFSQAQISLLAPYSFKFSSRVQDVSLDLFLKTFSITSRSPFHTMYNGSANCKGDFLPLSFNCHAKSQPLNVQIKEGKAKIASFYDVNVEAHLKSKKGILLFEAKGTKNNTTSLNMSGQYLPHNQELALAIEGQTRLEKDTQFHIPLSLKGNLQIQKGNIYATEKEFSLGGFLVTKNLSLDGYKLDEINTFFNYQNNILSFKKIKGYKGRSSFKGEVLLDLKKEQIQTTLQSSFMNMRDILESTQKKIKWPFHISGTGEGSLSYLSSFSKKRGKSFRLRGNLFNSFIEQEKFKTVSFDLSADKGQGLVSLLEFQKEKGKIEAQGTFDKNFNLNLEFKGYDIPLERIQTFNRFLPLQQSGMVNFVMDLQGPLYDPSASLKADVTKANLYVYPIENSQFFIKVNRKGVQLSGNLMNQFEISKFFYPFKKNQPLFIKGNFSQFDFIKTILAYDRKENPQNHTSRLTGKVELSLSKKDFSPIDGVLSIQDFNISKGKKWFQNKNPFSVEFKNKNSYLNPVTFSHHNRKLLEIKKEGDRNLAFSGYHSLDYWSFAFVFLNKIEGDVKIDLVTNKNLTHLQPKGTIKIEKGLFALDLIPAFKDITSLWKITNNRIFIQDFKSVAGNGTNFGSGQIIYKNPKEVFVNFNLNFKDTYLNIPEGFFTKGYGNINISGKTFPYFLKGSYTIESGIIKNEFSSPQTEKFLNSYSILNEENKNKKSPFNLDIDLRTQQAIQIKNSFINSNIDGVAKIYGPLRNLLIHGEFKTSQNEAQDRGSIIFKEQEFKIKSGNIAFNHSPPENPTLNISAQTLFEEKSVGDSLESSRNTEKINEYKIFLNAEGMAQNMNISLRSQPHLSKKEIISLLTLGVSTRYFEEHIKQNVTQYSYHLLGSFLLQKPLSQELRSKLGLNLSISPTLNTKTNEPVTKITLKRNWFGNTKTSFSRTLEEFPVSDARIRYDLNPNFSLTASWLNTDQNIVTEDFIDRDQLGLDLEFNFEF